MSDGTTSVPATVTGTVTPVADAPQVGVPAAQATAEDSPLQFSSANGNALSVADADGGNVTVTVGVTHGSFTLGSLAGVDGVGQRQRQRHAQRHAGGGQRGAARR